MTTFINKLQSANKSKKIYSVKNIQVLGNKGKRITYADILPEDTVSEEKHREYFNMTNEGILNTF